jgi:hypothetical protein
MAHNNVTVLFREVSDFHFSTPQNGQQFCILFSYYHYYYLEYIELISSQSAVRMPVQAMHHERFSKRFLQLFSVRSLHDN